MTHIPTGIQAVCQSERNQILNKKIALDNLKKKLIDERDKELKLLEENLISLSLKNLDRVNND